MAATTSPSGFPDATNTGVPAGTVLTPYNGDLVINTPGAVISGLDIHGTVYINAPNVTLIDCQITHAYYYQVKIADVTGVTVQNCTINGVGTGNDGSNGIQGTGTFINNNIYNVENGIAVDGSGPTVIQGNYIHNLMASGAPHYDGIQIDGGLANITITHNTVINSFTQTSAIMIDNYYGPISNVQVDNNLLVGGGYTVYVDGQFSSSPITGVSITNNHVGGGYWGATDFNKTAPVYTGNISDGATLAQTLNGAGQPQPIPAAPTIASFSTDSGVVGDHITDANMLTLTGTAVAGSAVKVFDGTTQIGTATANSIGAWTVTTAKLADGNHSLTATDAVSGTNSTASAPLSVTIDTVAPNPPVETAASIVSGTTKVQLTGTAEANSSLQVFDGTTQVGTTTANSSGAWSLTTNSLASGGHSFTTKATDAAGNISTASAALAVTIPPGPSAPAAPTIGSFSTDSGVAGDHITNDNTLTLSGTAVANSAVKVFDGSTQIGTTAADSSGSWSYITSVLTNAVHLLTATDTVSGVTSAASLPLSVTVDTVAPAAPFLVSDSVVNTNRVLLSGTAEANSTVTVYDGTATVGTTTTGANGTWSVTTAALASGAQALTATVTDVAGNVSAKSKAMDPVISTAPTPPPAAPHITSYSIDSGIIGDHITNDNTPTLTGTALANSTFNVFDGMTQIGTATANSSGQWHLTTKVLSDGPHNLSATDTDSAGHISASSASFSVTIDTHAPGAPTMAVYSQGGSAVGNTTALNDLVLKGTAEANSTIDVFDSGKQIGTASTSASGAWSLDTGHLANGSHSFTATATDVAGNISAASLAKAETVTAPATPTTPIEFTNVAYSLSNHTATIKGTADAYSEVKLYDGTLLLGTVTASGNGTWSLTNSRLSDTLHTIKAQEFDSTGHAVATSSGAVILAASNTSTLTGTGGNDFLFSSSSNMNDTFVFAPNFGHSTIEGFTVTGAGQDTVQFSKSVFDSFASVLAHATQVGHDVVISADASDSVTLKNIKLSALNSHDFHFA